MKNLINIVTLSALAVVLMASSYIVEEEGEKSSKAKSSASHSAIDKKSSIVWEGGKFTGGKHYGTIAIKESSLYFVDDKLVGGYFTMDMNSLKNSDLDESSAKKLEGHLKSDDFFGVSKYPTSRFVITEVKNLNNPGEYMVTGDLTIKSTTLPISFPVNLKWEGNETIATATVTIDRADFDVRYGSGRFFDGLGDKAIKDEFTLDIRILSALQAN